MEPGGSDPGGYEPGRRDSGGVEPDSHSEARGDSAALVDPEATGADSVSYYPTPLRNRGRRLFTLFSVLNSISFLLLSGNILTLFLLRLGADRAFIGLVSSFLYVSFLFMPVGKRLAVKDGVVRVFSRAWLLRYVSALPILLAPVLVWSGRPAGALGMTAASVLLFNVFRGIGIVGQSPLLGELSAGRDRGKFLVRFQIIANAVAVAAGITVALLLGERAPLGRFALFLGFGMAMGIIGAIIMGRIPEPPGIRVGASSTLRSAVGEILRKQRFRRFVVAFFVFGVVAAIARSFLIVFVRDVYRLSDGAAIGYAVVGNIGAIAVGVLGGLLLDRVGAKPLMVAFTALAALAAGIGLASPPEAPVVMMGALGVLFFLVSFGLTGAEASAQSYYYVALGPRDQINMGIIYFLTLGIGGAVGSLGGGSALELLVGRYAGSPLTAYRIFWGFMIGAGGLAVILFSRIERLGAYSFRRALSVMFSVRDLRALTLLNRLDRSRSIEEEQAVIRHLGQSHSPVAVAELVAKLDSPSFSVRKEALEAIANLPPTPATTEALIAEVREHEFTTGYSAARILGRHGVRAAVPVLREAVFSEDYQLAAAAIEALAMLADSGSIDRIAVVLRVSDNPNLIIHAAAALHQLGSTSHVLLLLTVLSRDPAPPFLRDEIILSVAGLCGIGRWFYPYYSRFLRDPQDMVAVLRDDARKLGMGEAEPVIGTVLSAPKEFASRCSDLVRSSARPLYPGANNEQLARTIGDERVFRFERARFLFASLLFLVERRAPARRSVGRRAAAFVRRLVGKRSG